jgi:hypothetical protein
VQFFCLFLQARARAQPLSHLIFHFVPHPHEAAQPVRPGHDQRHARRAQGGVQCLQGRPGQASRDDEGEAGADARAGHGQVGRAVDGERRGHARVELGRAGSDGGGARAADVGGRDEEVVAQVGGGDLCMCGERGGRGKKKVGRFVEWLGEGGGSVFFFFPRLRRPPILLSLTNASSMTVYAAMPPSTKFFRASDPVAPAPSRHTRAPASAAWPSAPHTRSWRSYFRAAGSAAAVR